MKYSLLLPGILCFAFSHSSALSQVFGDTFSYFYGENIRLGNSGISTAGTAGEYDYASALPGDFEAYQVRNYDLAVVDSGISVAQSPNLIGVAPGVPATFSGGGFSQVWDLGSGYGQQVQPVLTGGLTEVITGAILYLNISALQPNNATHTFTLFAGANGIYNGTYLQPGTAVSTFTLTDPAQENQVVAIPIPTSLLGSAFSIGSPTPASPITAFSSSTESNGTASLRPGFAITTAVVPEPATGLLGLLGSLVLLKRRRA